MWPPPKPPPMWPPPNPPPACPPPAAAASAFGVPARATPVIKAIMILRNIVHSPSDGRVNLRTTAWLDHTSGASAAPEPRTCAVRSMTDAWGSWDDLKEWELIRVAFTGEANSVIRGHQKGFVIERLTLIDFG